MDTSTGSFPFKWFWLSETHVIPQLSNICPSSPRFIWQSASFNKLLHTGAPIFWKACQNPSEAKLTSMSSRATKLSPAKIMELNHDMLTPLSYPPRPLYSDSSSVSTRALGGWTPGRGDQRGDTRHRGTDWWKRILNWKLEGRAETPACSRTVLWSLCRGRQKAAACVTHQPGSSCQAPAPSLGFKLVPSLQLWGGKYKIFKHLLTYWTDVASRPFPKPCKVCLLLFLEHTFHD